MNVPQNSLRFLPRNSGERSGNGFPSGIPACALLLLGTVLALCKWFPSVDYPWWAVYLWALIPAAALLFLRKDRIVRWVFLVGMGLILVFCLGFWKNMVSGMGSLGNDFLVYLSEKTGRIYLDFAAADPDKVLWSLIPILGILVLFITQSIRTRSLIFVLPILLPVYLAVFLGLFAPGVETVALTLGAVLLLVNRTSARGQEAGFTGTLVQLGVILLGLAVAIGMGSLLKDVAPADGMQFLEKTVHQILYHTDSVSMPEGDLKNLSAWEKSDTPALELTMEQPGKVYLRGTVYDVYTGTSWESADSETLQESEALFYWLHQSDFYGQSQIALASQLTAQMTPQTMTIKNLSACTSHGYLPYALFGSEALDGTLLGDTRMEPAETISYLSGSVPEWYLTQMAMTSAQNRSNVQAYLKLEQAYEDYVTAVDTQLTESSWAVLRRRLDTDDSPKTLSQIRQIIRDYLEDDLVYDEYVRTYNGNGDFLQYTLEQSGSGYSVHYATAATLMLRYFGVPARYVEGYFLSAEEAARYAAGETIILTEAHAHAWAEYYLPGVGFIPFEVTPGYMDDEELQLGGNDAQTEQMYQSNDLQYAQVQQPEQIREPEQNRISFSMKFWHLLVLLALLLLLVLGAVLYRRRRFKKKLLEISRADHRDAITMLYGYARCLLKTCPAESTVASAEVDALNQEAMFSSHEMTSAQREQMDVYTKSVLTECRARWSLRQKLYHYLWDCLY